MHHIQCEHLIHDLEEINPIVENSLPYLQHVTSYEHENVTQWEIDISTATLCYPLACSWRCGNSNELCGYRHQTFGDYLVHNFYHAHLQRLRALSGDFPQCHWQWKKTADIYVDQKRQISCQWAHTEDSECGYLCLVPDLLQFHVNAEVESEPPGSIACKWENQCSHQVSSVQSRSRTRLLQVHAASHLGVKQAICKTCNSQFATHNTLRHHHEGVGRRVPARNAYKCTECDRAFNDLATLSAHHRYVHSITRNFGPCRFCKKSFKSRNDYKNHVKTHTSDREQLKCVQCEFVADTPQKINHHKRKVHDGVKGYLCHFCDKVYTRGFKLSRHLRKEHPTRSTLFTKQANSQYCKLAYTLQPNGYFTLTEDHYTPLGELRTVDFSRQVVSSINNEKLLLKCQYCQKVYLQDERHKQHEERCDMNPRSEFYQMVRGDNESDQVVPQSTEQEENEIYQTPTSSELIDDGDKHFVRFNFANRSPKLYQVVHK